MQSIFSGFEYEVYGTNFWLNKIIQKFSLHYSETNKDIAKTNTDFYLEVLPS